MQVSRYNTYPQNKVKQYCDSAFNYRVYQKKRVLYLTSKSYYDNLA